MTEAVLIVLISSIGGTFLTVIGSIIQQAMIAKVAKINAESQKAEHQKAESVTSEIRQENRGAFDDLKLILSRQQDILDKQQRINTVIMRDRLRFLLKSHQDKDAVLYSEKEDIDAMYKIYEEEGNNGTIKQMYEKFIKLKIV